jgi:hypothetical protein
LTHDDLRRRAIRWLYNTRGCRVVLSELQTQSLETPDAIGWKSGFWSVLVECKTSVDDFYGDRMKIHRRSPQYGVGAERFYLAPKGVLRVEKIPEGWGLLEARGRRIFVAKRPPVRPESPPHLPIWIDQRTEYGLHQEMSMLVSALARVRVWVKDGHRPLGSDLHDWVRWTPPEPDKV